MMDANNNKGSEVKPGAKAHSRNYDALDRILAERPLEKAPANTSMLVLARIAALSSPQVAPVAAQMQVKAEETPVVVRYAPPAALPLPEDEPENEPLSRGLNFYFFAMAWIGLCVGVGFLLWTTLISPLFSGQSSGLWDMLVGIKDWFVTMGTGIGTFVNWIAPYLPSIISLLMGLTIMVVVLRLQQRRTLQD